MRSAVPLAFIAVAVLGLVAGAAGLLAGPAVAKEFSVESVTIDATVRPNGDMMVTETRVLDFSGQFSFVYWDLNTAGSDGIEVTAARGPDVRGSTTVPYERIPADSVRSAGTYWWFEDGGSVRVQLNFSVVDATATFSIDYIARGAAKRWADTSELYWQFVGGRGRRQGDTARHTAEPMEGSPADLAATLVEYGAAGAGHVQLVLDPITMESVELAGEALLLVR